MISLLARKRSSPIGVDIGARGVKLVQLSRDRTHVEASRWSFTSSESPSDESIVDALRRAYSAASFRGREVSLCLSSSDLFLQNIRVPREGQDLDRRILREAIERLPFPAAQAEMRFLQLGDVRQAETVMREVAVLACLRDKIDHRLSMVDQAGFTPVGLEVEPLALARSVTRQHRRSDESDTRAMIVHIGYSRTLVVVSQDGEVQFVKYIDAGGRDIDKAVAEHLHLKTADAAALRRHDDDQAGQGPEVDKSSDLTVSIARASRPVFERLAQELVKCIRYFSVTFRGAPLSLVSLSGGEANESLRSWLADRLKVNCDLSESLRGVSHRLDTSRAGNWDIAMGLALRERQ